MVKIWKIFDLRRKVRHVLADGHKTLLQEGRPFTTLPDRGPEVLRARRNAYYPLPPIYNWLSAAGRINETREHAEPPAPRVRAATCASRR
jgi:hypothetical protein